ncbi:MAG: translation initiation factor IF-2 N-terminal domain-containing protein, partial [Acidimicrobiales bacterium]
MAPKKIRVHELSKELGLTSKELLALAQKLGIGASSPSASIEDAQADRIRRRADADGLRREVPAEPVKAGKAEKAEKASKATKATKATKSVASASLEPAAKPEIVEATRAARASAPASAPAASAPLEAP